LQNSEKAILLGVVRTNDITQQQMETARQMRALRLFVGMTRTKFSKVIGLEYRKVEAHERSANPWNKTELQSCLAAVVNHLKTSLDQAESLAAAFTVNEQTETTHHKL
jgi:hypothetical protein